MFSAIVSRASMQRGYYKVDLKCLNCDHSKYFMYTGQPNLYNFPDCPNCLHGLYEATFEQLLKLK